LSANLDQLKRQAASTTDQDVQLRALEREAKAQRELFESYLAKYREATARDSIAAAPADARVISRAVVSNVPHFPKKLPIVLIAAFATFCLSTAFVTTSALLDEASYRLAPLRIDTNPLSSPVSSPVFPLETPPAAPVRLPDAPTPVTDPLPATPNLVAPAVQPIPAPTIDEVAAGLRQAGDDGRRVTVIGSAVNVGTTLSAIALARSLAQTARVVLVDLAFRAPNIEVISEEPAAPGIADLVRGVASFNDIITRDRSSRLHLVAAGKVGADADDLIGSPMLASAVGALAQGYDHLVIDAGAPSEAALASIVAIAPQAVLVGGDAAADARKALADHLLSIGFVAVTVLTGPPPRLDHPARQSTAA
jgi:Mrp family chromosome partitioning ATPase